MDAEKRPRAAYYFDCFTLDLARGVLLASDGAELILRPKSFALLQLFVENAGRLLDRDAIMQAVWPDVFVTDDSIAQCVHDIRRVLGDAARGLLRTVPRRGYLFTAEVLPGAPALPIGGGPRPAGQVAMPEQRVGPPLPDAASGAEPLCLSGQSPLPGSDPENLLAECLPVSEQIEAIGLSSSPRAERRHLSVLFCELVGSTTLAEQLDPEDLGGVIHIYRELCSATIAQCGGHIASYTSDGLLAFFGYPNAFEDAAERSVRAGLSIVEAAAGRNPGPGLALQVRVGIATGLMVVSDLTGESAQGRGAVGMPLNMAIQLQTIAAAGSVIISNSTRCLVGGLFAVEDLGCHPLKGFTAPVRAWQVTGQGAAESRFEALRGTGLTPLVGRGQEVTLLLDRWKHAKEGEGQAVLLVGEPGIGKSRLIQAVRDQLNSEPHVYVGCYCSPHSRDNPLRPVIAHLERAANFTSNDDPARKIAKLETLLGQDNEDIAQVAPLIASLLSIPSDGRYPPHNMSPQLQREQTLAALVEQLARLALRRPLLLVWEDVHWADPTSMELLGLMVDRLQSLRMLALVTFRTEFIPPWPRHTHVTWLTLNRLGRRQCSRLVAGLTGGKSLPATVLDQIAAKADGMPLFVEELTKAVLESGLLREADDRYELDGKLPPPAIPATLQDLLMARLDRQPSVKEIAQVAAVIGREFSHELLARVIFLDDKLTDGLRCLVAAELIFGRGMAPHAAYIFKHALVRDAAYASLLKGQRRTLHARIATVLEERFAQVVEAEPDMLAHHWAEAGQAEKAVVYRLKAGERALARSATTEALAQLTMGGDLLQSLPEGAMRHHRELDLRIALGAALSAAKGQAAPETVQAYARAHELCGKLGEEQRLVPVLLGLWSSHNARDELGAARTVAAQLLHLAEQKQNGAARLLGHRALGATLFGLGEFTAARTHLEQLLTPDGPQTRLSSVALPYDPCVSGRAWLSLTLSVLGYPEQALVQADLALAEADRLQHHNTTSLVLCLRCSLGQFLRDHHDVARHAEALLGVAVGQGFAYWAGLGTYFRGWAKAAAGTMAAGIEEMRQALAACRTTGAQAYVPYNVALLADMHRRAGDVAEGRTMLDEALDHLRQTDARYCEAELLRIDGELRLAMVRPDRDGAEASFRRAIEIAHRQDAKSVELQAAISLARLWAGAGRRQEACDLLIPIHGWFTEGFTTTKLVEAKHLLASLA